MKLYLVRHGEAEKVGGRISRDADRRLTATGEETSLWVGRALGRIDPAIGTILTSPLVRAVQTEMLTPGFRPKDLLKELFALPSVESIVAVGHEPDISRCLGYLIADGSHVSVTMGTGAVAGVELRGAISEYEAALLWFLTPPVVRALFS
jgi:phosphohistidine phosphatase SixA